LGLFLKVRVLFFEGDLVSAEMEVENFLLLKIVLHFSPDLKSLLNSFLDRSMTCLELVHDTGMPGQFRLLKEVLSFAWVVLDPGIDRLGNLFHHSF